MSIPIEEYNSIKKELDDIKKKNDDLETKLKSYTNIKHMLIEVRI